MSETLSSVIAVDAHPVRIARRFRGPATSSNGGYCAGLMATHVPAPVVTVRLLKPPPLERDLVLRPLAGDTSGTLQLVETTNSESSVSERVIAIARSSKIEMRVPKPVSYPEALAASQHFTGRSQHIFPECFVCGTQRERGDGLRLFAGPLDSMRVAAPWIPDPSLADEHGKVRAEFLWAALDCPGYFAAAPDGRMILLGEMTAQVLRSVPVDESCTVLAWRISVSGRRHEVGTALFDGDHEPCAVAHAWWIEPREAAAFTVA